MSSSARGVFLLVLCLGCAEREEAPARDAAPPPPPPVVDAAQVTPALYDDLSALRRAGVLRALVYRAASDDVPRAGTAQGNDASALELVAQELGLPLQRVVLSSGEGLGAALAQGKGDISGEPLVVTNEPTVAFGTPLRTTDLVVVTARTNSAVPKNARDLAKKKVAARALDGAVLGLERLRRAGTQVETVTVPDSVDPQELLARVGSGEEALAVVRSDDLDNYLAYADDVRRAFVLATGLKVAWAVRPASAELRQALASSLYARELTQHQGEKLGGDLDAIVARKVLRVAMLNNNASYFLYRGQEVGFQYELASLLASRLGVRLQVVVPERPDDLIELVTSHKVDLAPLALSEPPNPSVALSRPFAESRWLLVQPADEPPVLREADLEGREVHVRPSSAYATLLRQIAARVRGLTIVDAPDELETEELIDEVGNRARPLTVSNSILLDVERTYREDVQGTLVLADKQPLVYGMRRDAPNLKARIDELLKRELTGVAYKTIYERYFRDKKRMAELRAKESSTSGVISPYDELARRFGREFNVDWRLILAQMYQESRFDPNAKSFMGALGLMQIMPRTGKELGLRDLRDPEGNVRAGVQYLARLIARFEPTLPMRQRVRFALAGYNAGLEHVFDARILAKKQGLDPDRWFGNVERAMLLLEKPKYYRRARRGFCRGREPVAYVSRIQSKYDAYVALIPGSGPEDE